MSKGGWTRDTRVVSVRLDAAVYSRLGALAEKLAARRKRPVSVGDYVKFLIETQALRHKPGPPERRRQRGAEGDTANSNPKEVPLGGHPDG